MKECVMKEIYASIQKYDNIIVTGGTGSGKSTKLPQILYKSGNVIITQPRRVSTVTLAKRISMELKSKIGETVGYKIRFESIVSKNTKIFCVTEGILLKEIETDMLLSNYDYFVLDEIHERTVLIDILLSYLKYLQSIRKIKIILVSATGEIEMLSDYLDFCPVYNILDKKFPIKIIYNDLLKVEDIIMKENKNTLVFLPGINEIEEYSKKLKNLDAEIFILHSTLRERNFEVFKTTETRKIILSTNIAETSITLPNIECIIDTGMCKEKIYFEDDDLESLETIFISKDSAIQRTGRTGRTCPGICYRLYTFDSFQSFIDNRKPEIQRIELSNFILKIMHLIKVSKIEYLKLPASPSLKSLNNSISKLLVLGFIEENFTSKEANFYEKKAYISQKGIISNIWNIDICSFLKRYNLTQLGNFTSIIPFDFLLSKIISEGIKYNLAYESVMLASILTSEIFFNINLIEISSTFISAPNNDFDLIIKLFYRILKSENKIGMCNQLNISYLTFRYTEKIFKQTLKLLKISEKKIETNINNKFTIKNVIINSLYINTVQKIRNSLFYQRILYGNEDQYLLSTNSTVKNCNYLIFYELRTKKKVMNFNIEITNTDLQNIKAKLHKI
ncbi:putative helicase [Hamiltosporidium tvaerminnensis]|uniref:Putative helicase n=2 Tax=Hamiltosporidium tvaerminnensis TaxID=1176355 RepID=A0A4Q9M0D9_9MICR|nr:putative helicase [Hamiltosporidium tvaerminnensis]